MLEKLFKIQSRGSSLKQELYASLVIFTTVYYIAFVLPGFLGSVGVEVKTAFISICLAMAISSIIFGLFTNLPLIIGSTSTITIMIAYTIVQDMGFTYGNALVIALLSSIIAIIFSFFISKDFLDNMLPYNLKTAISSGIGFFILLIGLKNAGIVVPNPSTFIAMGDVKNPQVILTFIAVLILIIAHSKKKFYLSFLVIIALSAYAYFAKETSYTGLINTNLGSIPFFTYDFSNLFRLSLFSAVLGLLLAKNFDTLATLLGYSYLTSTEYELPKILRKLYFTQGLTSAISTLFGAPSNGLLLEGNAGIPLGAKTGIVPIVVGILFLIMVFLSPLLTLIPIWATSPILILIGLLMGSSIKDLSWDKELEYLPALLCIIAMPLTHSIVNGIAIGFIAYTLLQLLAGRIKTVPIATIIVSILFVITFF